MLPPVGAHPELGATAGVTCRDLRLSASIRGAASQFVNRFGLGCDASYLGDTPLPALTAAARSIDVNPDHCSGAEGPAVTTSSPSPTRPRQPPTGADSASGTGASLPRPNSVPVHG